MNNSLLLLLTFSILAACENGDKPNSHCATSSNQNSWTHFENEYFSICYPNDWTSDDSGTFGSEVTIMDHDHTKNINFGRNINVIKQETTIFPESVQTLDAYADFSRKQVFEYVTDCQILNYQSIKIDKTPAFRMMFTATQGNKKLHFEQLYFKHEQWFFVATFTTTANDSDASKKMGGAILQSIHLK